MRESRWHHDSVYAALSSFRDVALFCCFRQPVARLCRARQWIWFCKTGEAPVLQNHSHQPSAAGASKGRINHMLDLAFIRMHPDVVKEAARVKNNPIDIDGLLALDQQ